MTCCILLLSITFFFGTFLSTFTNGLAFIGGWIEQAGALTNTPKAVDVGIIASILMPSESLWRRAVFEMQSPLTTAVNFSPFSGASVPSAAMTGYAAAYVVLFLALALWHPGTHDL